MPARPGLRGWRCSASARLTRSVTNRDMPLPGSKRARRAACIDHHPHIGNGQRGFRDRGRQHDPPPPLRRLQRRRCAFEVHGAIQRHHLGIGVQQGPRRGGSRPSPGRKVRMVPPVSRVAASASATSRAASGIRRAPAGRGRSSQRVSTGRPALGPDHRGVIQQRRHRPASSVADATSSARSGRSARAPPMSGQGPDRHSGCVREIRRR